MAAWPVAAGPVAGAVAGAAAGAIIGSFIAAVALRWPAGESIVQPRSCCDGCRQPLRWWELVPIVSWLLLRGRCARCGAAIAPTHIIIELAAAAIGAAALYVAPALGGIALALLGWQLLLLGWLDARHYWLPHVLSAGLALSGLLLGGAAAAALGMAIALPDRIIGACAGFASLWLVAATYRRLRGREGLGGGDAPMFGAIGAWTGWTLLPVIMLFAAAAGIAIAMVRMARQHNGADKTGGDVAATRLPLGTLLAMATPAALIAAAWR